MSLLTNFSNIGLTWLARASLGAGATVVGLLTWAYAAGAWVNTTTSLAPGVYQEIANTSSLVAGESLVRFCLPEKNSGLLPDGYREVRKGTCPDGTAPMAKRLAAIDHDSRLTHNYEILTEGRFGALTAFTGDTNGCWVFGDHPHLLDSRYFDSVDCAVLTPIKPLFVMEESYYDKL